MSPQVQEQRKTNFRTLPQPKPQDYPHDSGEWPDDMVHSARPSQLEKALKARGHSVTTDANDLYAEAKHGVLPVKVRYFKPAGDQPWRITDRARILRALKLFAFFALAAAIILAFHLF